MYYTLGLLSAGIVALLIGPPLWRRAVRLTYRDIERSLPMTREEIEADKDQLRASFAVSIRRLETTVERLENQAAVQRIDLSHKRDIIAMLTSEESKSGEDIVSLRQQRGELRAAVQERDEALAEAKSRIADAERRFAEIEAKLIEARAGIEAMVGERETQRMELIARDTELDNLRDSVTAGKTNSTVGDVARASLESEMAELRAGLARERQKLEDAEAKRSASATELATLQAALAKAETRIEALSLSVVEAEAAGMSLFAVKEEKAGLEARIAALEAENARLRRDVGSAAGGDDAEADMLRNKLIEIGSAVARLSNRSETLTLVPAPPAPPTATPGTVANGTPAATPAGLGEATPVSLAERIRALQHASGGF